MAEERTVWVRIKAVFDDFARGFKEGMADAERASAKASSAIVKDWSAVEKKIQAFGNRVRNIGLGMSASLTAPLTLFAKQSVGDFAEAARAVADVEAALKSTGNTAGKTSEELQKFASDAQFRTLYQDEEILKSLTANLLTFKNVSGDTFDRAQSAALDMSARLGQDLQSSAIQLGKALNDPVAGLAALSRVGIQFTDAQEEMIKGLVKSGDLLKAQGMILDEVESQFKGAAEAQANAGGLGGVNEFNKQLSEIRETIGGLIVEIGAPFLEMLNGWLEAFRGLAPETQRMIVIGASIAAVLGPVLAILGPIISAFAALAPMIAALASPIGVFIAAVAAVSVALDAMGVTFEQQWNAVVALFNGIVDQLRLGVRLISQLFTGDLSGVLQTMKEMWVNLWQTIANVLDALFPGLTETISAWARGILTLIQEAWEGLVEFVKTTWTAVSTSVTTATTTIITAIRDMETMALEAVMAMVNGIKDWIGAKLNAVWETAKAGIDSVKGAFQGLYQAVVGGSYIPDMVTEIGQHMATLDENLVKPAEAATKEVASLFQGLAGTVKSYISEFIKTGKFDLERFIADISSKLIDWGLDTIFKNLFGGLGGGGGLLGGLFAKGGNPPLNKPSIVGENGPELFIPKVRGTIVSNRHSVEAMKAASNNKVIPITRGSVVQNINVYARDVDSFRSTENSLGRKLRRNIEIGQRAS
jgi:hypothetical protein